MDIKTIAKNNQVTERFVYLLIQGKRFTDLHFLATDIAALEKTRPIEYIRPDRRQLFRRIMPELARRRK